MIATNISDFRSNIRQYVDNVLNDGNAVLINRGNNAAVLISLDEYNSIRETEKLIHSTDICKEFGNGISVLKSGRGIVVDIDEL
ncbi:MAG: type II toxin-antitoxin system prevent-host-death family antitoxin [Bacteroidia bacterium]|nr:type II toxin-antitoxin system prevent-host-death family antitoxin [Bacteroidia bacterium]